MSENTKATAKHDIKVKLSSLWLFATLTYTYGDVVTLMDPVKHGSVQLSEGFLLGGSVFMMIPITMVLLSRILKYKTNRWMSIVAGAIMTVALVFTLFVAKPAIYYLFFTIIEIISTSLIVWIAWKWHSTEDTSEKIVLA